MFDTLIDPDANRGVGVAFTDRVDGTEGSGEPYAGFNLGRIDQIGSGPVSGNFATLAQQTGIDTFVLLSQVHGPDVVVVDETNLADHAATVGADGMQLATHQPVADAAVTALPNVGLLVRVADCTPVLFADFERGVLGAAHAGRSGMLAGVLTSTVDAMKKLGAANIKAWIGPHICGACYELPAEMVADAALVRPEAVSQTSWGTPALDLGAGCAAELDQLGITVERHDPCTLEHDHLYSHRGEAAAAGRQVGMIWRVGHVTPS